MECLQKEYALLREVEFSGLNSDQWALINSLKSNVAIKHLLDQSITPRIISSAVTLVLRQRIVGALKNNQKNMKPFIALTSAGIDPARAVVIRILAGRLIENGESRLTVKQWVENNLIEATTPVSLPHQTSTTSSTYTSISSSAADTDERMTHQPVS